MTHPIRLLRNFLKSDPRTRAFATQEGLADLLDCSAGLIRRIEQGTLPASPKLALKIEGRLGIQRNWVYSSHPSEQPISNLGEPATMEWILKHLEGGQHRRESQGFDQVPAPAEFLGEWVKRSVSEALSKNDMTLFNKIVGLLSEETLRGAGEKDAVPKKGAAKKKGTFRSGKKK